MTEQMVENKAVADSYYQAGVRGDLPAFGDFLDTKARCKFPHGDFERVHRCGLNAAEVRAARQKYLDIEDAAVRLREMMDKQDR